MVKTITIKGTHIAELVEVFGEYYTEEIYDDVNNVMIPNPQTKEEFASERFDFEWRSFVTSRVMQHRKEIAANSVNDESIIE